MSTSKYTSLMLLFIFTFAVYGWVANLIKLFNLDGMSGELALRAIGIIIAPLGAIMGYV